MEEDSLVFTPPGKGHWRMNATHVTKPVFGLLAEMFQHGLSTGMRDGCKRYGLLLETIEVRMVNGFPYSQPRPVGAPEGGGRPPPRILFRALTALHPELRRRLRRARTLFEDRPWREEIRDWHDRVKPRTIAAHAKLAEKDLGDLSTVQLAEHIEACMEHACRMLAQD